MPARSSRTNVSIPHHNRLTKRLEVGQRVGRLACWLMLVALLGVGCEPVNDQRRTGIIVGASMAPALLGEHFEFRCSTCGFTSRVDRDSALEMKAVVCSNCGHDQLVVADAKPRPAEQVVVESGVPIRRWDIVAAQLAGDSESVVKRVIGLPGERIRLFQGNLFRWEATASPDPDRPDSSGAWSILTKPDWVVEQTRILVHDTGCPAEPFRWQPAVEGSWEIEGHRARGHIVATSGSESTGVAWLQYVPHRDYLHFGHASPPPIEDYYAFNASLSRSLHAVDELELAIELEASPDAVLTIEFDQRGARARIEVDLGRARVKLAQQSGAEPLHDDAASPDGSSIVATEIPNLAVKPGIQDQLRLRVRAFDHQLSVWINDRCLMKEVFEPGNGAVATRPVRWGIARGTVTAHRIRLYRDLYYFGATELAAGQPDPPDRGGYLLLGDNVPRSVDSRHWKPARVPAQGILGVVQTR